MAAFLALHTLAALLGGMVFFAAVVAPLVFTRLPADQSGPFIRATFPAYYLYLIVNAGFAAVALALLPDRAGEAVAMAAVALATVWLRQSLMPRINALRDRAIAGEAAAEARFGTAHRLSVAVNLVQMLVVAAVLTRLAL